ncbi:MAG: damage-inducible protein DinB [Mucilaginibacter sp.]|nr:damage-inducible protein DinB [Mucilaginibacter sp.]
MYLTLLKQYQFLLEARGALLDYCEKIKPGDLSKQVPVFNNNSINYLLVHNANVYIHWLAVIGMQNQHSYFDVSFIKEIKPLRMMYDQVNLITNNFLHQYKNQLGAPINFLLPGESINLTISPLQLFTHVITHEFHHKGQILTMSRLLGYTPVDTDIIRF